jgi:hypothetical protein
MNNKIYFRRASKIAAPDFGTINTDNFALVASFDANLRKTGYALHGDLAVALLRLSDRDLVQVCLDTLGTAREVKGVRNYRPMYPNFPSQVMAASDAELYLNAIVHYFGTAVGINILPVYDEKKRPDLVFDESKLTLVRLGDRDDYLALLGNLFGSKSAFSETDKADVKALQNADFIMAAARASFDNRENKATIAAEAMKRGVSVAFKFDTATDVLRLAAALSDGDVSLAENTKFRSFKRAERRHLLSALNNVGNAEEDMLRHEAAWKRLGERLHPGEFNQFANAQRAFAAVRENGAVEVFNARVEKALAANDIATALRSLTSRPGEFARRLDHVLRIAPNQIQRLAIVAEFRDVAEKVSPTVLIQTRNAFLNRDKNVRVFFPKGSVAKMQSMKDERTALSVGVRQEVIDVIDAALVKQFASRSDLGGTYVDPSLKGVAVPFGLRNASAQLKTLGRGSRLSLDATTGVIRFFIWWKDSEGDGGWGYRNHTDIDLSAVVLDKNFNHVFDITYYNLREKGAVHSGDITSAPNGASEFIDIDIEKVKKQGGRYVAMTLHVYSGQKYSELPECFAGFMERQNLDSGEIYDPRTVVNKADLTANSSGATPFIFDLETGEAIWVDLSMAVAGRYGNVASTKGQIVNTVEAMAGLTPPNLYDLFTAHGKARGGLVEKDAAKTVFGFDGDVTPFDTEEILANYL